MPCIHASCIQNSNLFLPPPAWQPLLQRLVLCSSWRLLSRERLIRASRRSWTQHSRDNCYVTTVTSPLALFHWHLYTPHEWTFFLYLAATTREIECIRQIMIICFFCFISWPCPLQADASSSPPLQLCGAPLSAAAPPAASSAPPLCVRTAGELCTPSPWSAAPGPLKETRQGFMKKRS